MKGDRFEMRREIVIACVCKHGVYVMGEYRVFYRQAACVGRGRDWYYDRGEGSEQKGPLQLDELLDLLEV